MADRQTISIVKACELVGVSRRTLYNWIAAGKVEYIRTAGGSIRIYGPRCVERAAVHARRGPTSPERSLSSHHRV